MERQQKIINKVDLLEALNWVKELGIENLNKIINIIIQDWSRMPIPLQNLLYIYAYFPVPNLVIHFF
jgi:hypothetical protein